LDKPAAPPRCRDRFPIASEWPRLFDAAKLAEATALSSLKQEREARARSEEAVELSRGTAGPLLHLRALDLNVKLTAMPDRELRCASCEPP